MMRQSYGSIGSKIIIGLMICLLTATSSQAVSLYWNAPNGGTGTWDTGNLEWSTSGGGPVDTTWINAGQTPPTIDDAIFANSAGTVTVQAAGITAQSLTFDTANYVINGETGAVLTLAGTTPTVTANSNATINAVIGGVSGLTKAGGAQLTLGAGGTGNTYTGDTTITAGTLLYSNTNQLSAGGTNNIVFNGAGMLGTLAGVAETRNITMNSNGTIDTWGFDSTFSGVISGSGALTKTGNGALTLSGSNAGYTGQININRGSIGIGLAGTSKVIIGNADALGTGTINFGGGTIEDSVGLGTLANPVQINGQLGFSGSNSLRFTNTTTIPLSGWYDVTFTGAAKTLQFDALIAPNNNGDHSFISFGTTSDTLVLNGGIQTRNAGDGSWRSLYFGGYTNVVLNGPIVDNGSTTNAGEPYKVGPGTMTLASNVNSSYPRGAFRISEGTLVLDYTTGNASKLEDTGELRGYGVATVDLKGATSAYREVVSGFRVGDVGSALPGVVHITRSSGLATIGLNPISNMAVGGLLDVQDSIADTDQKNTNGIIVVGNRSSVTVGGTDWGVNSINLDDGTITAYTAYQTGAETGWAATDNVSVTDSATLTAGRTINTLKIGTTSAGQSLNIGAGNTLQLNVGGLLMTGSNGYSITGGTLKGGQTGTSDLVLIQNNSGLVTIDSVIANGAGASRLTKAGTGTLLISGANTYTGTTYPIEGTLQLGRSTNPGVDGPLGTGVGMLYMAIGSTVDLNGYDLTVGKLQGDEKWAGRGKIVNNSGSGTAKLTVGYNNPGNWGSAMLIADNTTGSGKVAVEKVGTNEWTINQPHTFTGGLTISRGAIRCNQPGSLSTGTITYNGTDTRIWFPGSLPSWTLNNDIYVQGYGTGLNTDSNNGTLTLNGTISGPGIFDPAWGDWRDWNQTTVLNGAISVNTLVIAKNAGGNNTYTYNFGAAGSSQGSATTNFRIGNQNSAKSRIQYNGVGSGTFYMGSLKTGGTVAGTYSSINSVIQNNVAGTTATFEIGALNASDDEFAGLIANGAGTTAVTKAGTGTLTLSGANTYTGTTTVNAGTLLITGTTQSPALVVNGGNLSFNNTVSPIGAANTTATINGGTLTSNCSLDNISSMAINNGGTFATTLVNNNGYIYVGSAAAGNVNVAGGGTINMYDTKVGTLSINSPAGSSLTVGSGGTGPSNLNFDFNGTATDLINLSSNFTVGTNGATINVSGISATGSFPLISYPYGVKNGTGALTLGTTPPPVFGLTYSLDYDSNNVYFKSVGYTPATAYWRGNLSSVWNYHSGINTNWTEDQTGATPLTNALPGSTTNVYFTANNVNMSNLSTTLGQDMGVNGLTFTSTVGPTHPVTINGSNSLSLGTGGITIDSGSGAHTIATSSLNLNGGQYWTNYSTSAFTVNAPITGGDAASYFSLSGGLFVFNGANTYASPTTIDSGATLRVGNANALGTGAVTLNGTLDVYGMNFTANALSGSGTITNNSSTAGSITLNINSDVNFYGVIQNGTGSLALVKTGTGKLILNGTDNYTGGTTINGGILNVANSDALGSSGKVIFGGGSLQYTSGYTTDYSARIKDSTSVIAIDAGGQDITYAGDIDGSNTGGMNITVGSPSNTFTLEGNNSYGGTTTIVDGIVKMGSAKPNALSSGLISLNTGGATLDLNGNSIANNIRINGTNSVIKSSTGTAVVTGTVTVDQGAWPAFYIGAVGDTSNLSFDRIRHTGGNGGYLVYQQTTGTVTLGGTLANDGETSVDMKLNYNVAAAGTVILNKSCTTPPPSNATGVQAADSVTLASAGATLQYGPNTTTGRWKWRGGQVSHIDTVAGSFVDLNGSSGVNSTVNNLRGDATVRNTSTTAAVIGVGASNDDLARDCTFNGVIEDGDGLGGGGTVGLNVVNPFFTFTLTNASTYTGPTNISGKLVLSVNPTTSTMGSISNSSLININAGSTFDVLALGTYTTGTGQTIAGGGQVLGNYNVAGGTIQPGSGVGTLTFANDLAVTGGAINFDISSSTTSGNDLISVLGSGNVSGTETVNVGTGAGYSVGTYTLINAVTALTADVSAWTTTWDRRGTAPTVSVSGNQVLLNVTAAGPGHNLNWAGTAGNPWDINTTVNWYNNTISAMDKYLSGDNAAFADTYNGIAVTNPNVALNSTISPDSVTFNNSAVNYTVSGTGKIAGTTGLVKSGTGSLTLSTVNTYSGDTTVNGGTLILTVGGATAGIRSTLNVNATGTVSLTAVDALGYNAGVQVPTVNLNGGTIDNAVVGNQGYRTNFVLTGGSMTSTGGGKYNFTTGYGIASNASATTSTISAGINVRDNSTMNFNVGLGTTLSGVDLAVSGAIEGGSISKSGSGKLSLSGTNTYAGNTSVMAGTLDMLDINTPSATVSVAAGANTLIAKSITANTLTIGAGAKVVIKPLGGGPLSGAASLSAVPEPSTWAMLMLAAMGLGMYWRRSR